MADDQGGQAVVEFALILPMLVLLVVAILDFGFFFQARSALRDGVRAAARQASLCRSWTSTSKQPATVYDGIVSSSMANPPAPTINPSITWDSVTNSATNCSEGEPVTVTATSSYSAGFLGLFSIPVGSLKAQAESIVE